MPQYSEKMRLAVSAFDRRAQTFERNSELVHKALSPGTSASAESNGADGVNSWSQFIWRGLGSFFEAGGIAVFVPFLMIVMLSEKELLADAFERLADGAYDIGLIERETAQMVRAYFYGNLSVGAAMVFLHWLLFAGLGLKNAVGLGLVSGLLTLVPLIGLPAALLLPTAQALFQFDRIAPFVLLAMSMTTLHLLTANYLIPSAIGGRVKINATAATAGLLFWGWLWGVTGFALAVPLTALLKILLESNKDTEACAGLLAAKPREARRWFGRRWLAGVEGRFAVLDRARRGRPLGRDRDFKSP
jgi:predicted PurR-regulated permease PerM